MRATTLLLRRTLGLSRTWVREVAIEGKGMVVTVAPGNRRPRCGGCGKRAPGYDQVDERDWRHLGIGAVRVWLRYAPRRVECAECGVRVERVPWASPGSMFTLPFEEMVAYLAQATDKTKVTRLMGSSWQTVGSIVSRVVQRCLDPERLKGLRTIGVDEFSYRKHHHYLTVVVDHEKERVVWTGTFVLTTNTKLSAAEVATTYKSLWRVERAFRTEKSALEVRPIYHHTDQNSIGHIVACFLALRLEVDLQHRLDEKGVAVSWPDLMRDLAQVQAVLVEADGKQYRLRTDLAGQAQAAFAAAGVRPPSLATLLGPVPPPVPLPGDRAGDPEM